MKKLFILFTLSLWLAGSVLGQTGNRMYFKFVAPNDDALKQAKRIVTIYRVENDTIYAYGEDYQLDALTKLKIDTEIIAAPDNLSRSLTMATTVAEMANWDRYPTYEVYVEMMQSFAADYPDICQLESIGDTYENHELLVVKISDNVAQEENEPEVLYTGQMHGDELIGGYLFLRLIDYMLENYGTDPQITNIIDNVELWINPYANPDGTYAGGNHTVSGSTRSNSNGVNLNRNFPDPEDGPHPDGNEWQLETVAMMDFAEERHFVLSANSHSGAEVINYPWDTWSMLHVDDDLLVEISSTYAAHVHANSSGYLTGFNNGITNGYAWYSINGGRQDYMTFFHGCREITFELSNDKLLDSELLPAHWDYNRDALLGYIEEALYGVRGTVTNVGGDPLQATITVEGRDNDTQNSYVYTDPNVGNYHRLIEAGTYTFTYSAYGYESETVDNIVVEDNAATIVDVVLGELPSVAITGTVFDASNGNPIENAKVELVGTPLPEAFTNANGEYEFPTVYNGNYTIKVTKLGYATVSQDIEITGSSTNFDFLLQPSVAESFESGSFSGEWSFGGSADWTIDNSVAYDGDNSARSGSITDDQTSTMSITIDDTMAGEISFFKKVSSESGYDFLRFYIDNIEQGEWSGEISWSEETFEVSEGAHTYMWEYSKDGSMASGSDCAWVDFITFPPTNMSSVAILSVSQNEIVTAMTLNSTGTETFEVSNIGGGTLDYTIEIEDGTATWLALDQNSGSLNAGENDEITITFDTNGLTNGAYSTNLNVEGNGTNTQTIAVTLQAGVVSIEPVTAENSLQIVPNPVKDNALISFDLNDTETVRVDIFSTDGQLVRTLLNETLPGGTHSVQWNCTNHTGQRIANGLYFCRISAGNQLFTGKIMVAF